MPSGGFTDHTYLVFRVLFWTENVWLWEGFKVTVAGDTDGDASKPPATANKIAVIKKKRIVLI